MKKIIFVIAFIAVILIVQGITITGQYLEDQKINEKLKEKQGPFIVARVIDGDTLVLNTSQKVRLSGINTPETQECYYEQAKQRLMELVLNKEVVLERDITDIDRYNRLLRYVYVNNTMINLVMVKEGYARVYDKYKDDTKYYDLLKLSEPDNIGIWLCENALEKCAYVASKNSDIYHNANSTIAKRINPENLLCFQTREQAEKAGFIAG